LNLTLNNKAKLKILHLTHTDIRTDSRILKELNALGDSSIYQLYAIGVAEEGAGGGVNVYHGATVVSVNLRSRTYRRLPHIFRHVLVFIEMSLRVLRSAWHVRPDLIHCHDTPLLSLSVFLAWIFRGKLIYDAHELESNKNGQSKMISRMTFFIEKACWSRINGFVTVSNSILRWYQIHFIKKDSALILNSPVVDDLQGKAKNEWYFHNLYQISRDCLVFVYLGLFVSGRGIEKLLEVFSDQKISAHIVFIGRGHLRDIIERYSNSISKIHLHDSVPHEQVVGLASNADYGVCFVENVSLSDYYSLPNKLFEYAFAGVPVLASDFPDMREMVKEYELGTVTSDNINSITDNIMNLELAGRQRLTKDLLPLSWHAQAEHLRALYRRVFAQDNAPNS
jgi:glycosyltransferase involved in cell wall biosynthesis